MECATFQMSQYTKTKSTVRDKRLYWTQKMIKVKQYFIKFCWKIKFDPNLSIDMTLNVGGINKWLTPFDADKWWANGGSVRWRATTS